MPEWKTEVCLQESLGGGGWTALGMWPSSAALSTHSLLIHSLARNQRWLSPCCGQDLQQRHRAERRQRTPWPPRAKPHKGEHDTYKPTEQQAVHVFSWVSTWPSEFQPPHLRNKGFTKINEMMCATYLHSRQTAEVLFCSCSLSANLFFTPTLNVTFNF